MENKVTKRLSIVFVWLASSCGSGARDRENYGDLAASEGGIVIINAEEHRGGWARGQCLVCHNSALNLHRRPGSGIDADALNDAVRNNGEESYCLLCHGQNGQ